MAGENTSWDYGATEGTRHGVGMTETDEEAGPHNDIVRCCKLRVHATSAAAKTWWTGNRNTWSTFLYTVRLRFGEHSLVTLRPPGCSPPGPQTHR